MKNKIIHLLKESCLKLFVIMMISLYIIILVMILIIIIHSIICVQVKKKLLKQNAQIKHLCPLANITLMLFTALLSILQTM